MTSIQIHIGFLDTADWRDAQECDFTITGNSVDIWRVKVSSNLPAQRYFNSILSPNEIARVHRFLRVQDQNRGFVSRGGLRYILSRYLNQSPGSIVFAEGPNKKPYLANPNNTALQYNISHSGDWVLFAIANSAVGADVEEVNHSFEYDDVLDGHFGDAEIAYIKQNPSPNNFFKLWTRKEALTKATEKGLDDDLKLIPCLDGIHSADSAVIASSSDMQVQSFMLNDDYIACIATHTLHPQLRFFDADFNSAG